MNFARDVVDAAPGADRALVEIDATGARREWTFAEISDVSARLAGTFIARGVRRGDVVMTLIGSRPQWVLSMLACFRIGAIALPCNEQLRAKDLRMRIDAAAPRLIISDIRNAAELSAALAGAGTDTTPAAPDGDGPPAVILIPDPSLLDAEPAPAIDLSPTDPCLITFTSGTTGAAKGIIHGQRYLSGQALQASTWLGARRGDLVWCTAASGWSKSARNAFIAPWLQGAAALVHDARFDSEQRLSLLASEQVNVLCMAPTEYRVIAKRATLAPVPSLRGLVAAGEALNPEVLRLFEEGLGLPIRDGYGQTETGQLTGVPAGGEVRPGSMGRPLPGIALAVIDGELVLTDPTTDPTFFVAYLDGDPAPQHDPWHTGDRVTADDDGFLFFEGRTDDVIISSGYRIGPFEVESALVSHVAVAEAAAVAAPDDERGSVVRAIVVLRDGIEPSDALKSELQDHVKAETAPYKYPRIVEFAAELPKTASGKVQRALLRGQSAAH
jgi:acyl-coenzyme A synthetase/AMP-(fatty) acid ligase